MKLIRLNMANEAKKRCPYCGEEILAVAKKCKHCGEWLDKEETKACSICGEKMPANASVCPHCEEPQTLHEPVNITEDTQEGILYCKHCKAPLSKTSQLCPHCGEDDPFYFKAILNNRKQTNVGCGLFFILAIAIHEITNALGENGGLLRPTPIQLALLVAALAFVIFIIWYLRKQKVEECHDEIEKIAIEKGDTSVMNTWKEMVEEIKNK